MARARILLADDHREMRELVARLLEPEFKVIAAVGDGKALMTAALQLHPDLCILDITMPFISGIEAATQLKESTSTAKIILLTIHEDFDFVEAAFKSGAAGYVVKSRMATDLCVAVREVLAGRTFVSASVNGGMAPLTS